MIQVHDLVKRYGKLVAIDHLSLRIRENEIYGLLGPNGSGKTTLINCMLALLSFDNGEIRIDEKDMSPTAYDLKQKIGIVPQEVAFFDELTVRENIDYFCGLYVRDKASRKSLVDDAISFTGLSEFVNFRPRKLSGGLKRRLNIACGIAHKPSILFLDEPTVAVDPQSRNHILQGVRALAKNGVTVVYTTHYMEEAEQICDRVGIIDKGQLLAEGTPAELKGMINTGDTIRIQLIADKPEALQEIRKIDGVHSLDVDADTLTVRTMPGAYVLDRLLRYLHDREIGYLSVASEKPSLNTVFLEITGRELRD
ncbi:MAG TPA: ABC transporter ATP-binding protein [Clostridiaceae bacterium]|nr:ABC transporter ATP-binding protein [Clostridiaceae bacterium]